MNQDLQAVKHDLEQLAGDAQALLIATADVAEEKVGAARVRLAATLARVREIAGTVGSKAVASARAANAAVHEQP